MGVEGAHLMCAGETWLGNNNKQKERERQGKENCRGRKKMQQKFEAREYQKSIAESVLKKGNSLVVMPTALGKTFVAMLVIKGVLEKEDAGIKAAAMEGGPTHQQQARRKKALFWAPTKPLISQQAKRITEGLDLLGENEVLVLSGETPPEKRGALWSDAGARV